MLSIPPALAGLAAYQQFCLFVLSPSSTRPGKTDKFPVDWRTGQVANAHDANIWTTFEHAIACVAAGVGHGVGFVFTERDPFFFVDIDNALQADGTWSATAQYLCNAFPGAAIEVSQSGTGLHIIGTGAHAAPPNHRNKNKTLNLEFYTRERFVALTGVNAVGDVRADMSVVVPWLCANYFPDRATTVGEYAEWSEAPRDDWRGPTDDEDLLRRALQSRSAGAVFGAKASFADLWEGNAEVLASVYPDANRTFDNSLADAALASHLAFWTGCNMERMERLMQRSALVRDKWEEHRPEGTWLRLTIINACGVQKDVCRDKEVVSPIASVPSIEFTGSAEGVAVAAIESRTGETYLHPTQQAQLFAGCVYVQDAHRVFVPSGALLRPDQFKTMYGGHVFVMDNGNEKTSRNAWEAFTESTVNTCPKVEGTCFRPELAPGSIVTIDGWRFVNTYTPIPVARKAGDASPFFAHMAKVLPDERDRAILLAYMAACVQHKGFKFQWAPLLQGVEGNGKSLFSRVVAHAIGERYTHWPKANQFSSQFNAWMEGRIFIGVEDVYLPDDRGEIFEILKPMITNDKQPIEAKGVDQISKRVCANFLLNSNHKDALKKTANDRRIAPFFCAQQSAADLARDGMSGDYFPRLYAWLRNDGYAIMTEFLSTYAIPDEFNPATSCMRAPHTTSTNEAIGASLGGVEQEIMEAVANDTPGFMGDWISSLALSRLLEKLNVARRITPRKREEIVERLGYVRHPALHAGRVNNVVAPDGGKPVLFVRAGSPALSIASPAEVAHAYSAAQGVAFGGAA